MALQSYLNILINQIQGTQLETAIQQKWSILAGTVAAYVFYKYLSRPKNLPPGPTGLPFIGAAMNMTNNLHRDCLKLSKKYKSDIISFYMGRQLQVVLNSADAIKQAFVKTDDFSHRDPVLKESFDMHDRLTSENYSEEWKKIKTFCLSSLKTHGFSKSEDNMKLQLTRMINHLENSPDNTMGSDNLKKLFAKAGASIIMKIVANQNYEFDDPELEDLLNRSEILLTAFFENSFILGFYSNMLPSAVMGIFMGKHARACKSAFLQIREFFQPIVEDHKGDLDMDNPRDFIDDFIIRNMKNPSMTGMTEIEITDTVVTFSVDAIDTVSTQLTWILYFICCNPDSQKKMLSEMKSVCGDDVPSLKDRSNMTYCEAVIVESMRMSSVAVFTVSHKNDKDTELGGYFIPKNTMFQGNLYAVHYDEKIFPEPTKFKPERFLTVQGKLTNVENVMPFGAGRRKCVGEALARSEAFDYVTGFVQKFQLSFPEGHEPAPFQFDDIDRVPPVHKIKFTARY